MKNAIKLIRFISFAIIIVLCMLFFSNTLMVNKGQSSTSRNQVRQSINAENNDTLDVLFMGDSTILNSVVPIELWENKKITSFNIGYGWAYPNEIFYDLKKIMTTQSPKYLFLESSFFVDTVEITQKDDNKLTKRINYINNDLAGKFNYVFPYVRYKSVIKDRSIKENLSLKPESINNIYKGYSFKDDITEAETKIDNKFFKKAIYIESGKEYFSKIYKLCEKNNCKIVILLSPQISDWSQEEHDLLCSLAKEYDVSFLDLNVETENIIEDFSWDKDSSDGGTHLNFSGATKTTKAIGDYLVNELGMKPTKLPKEQTEKWNNDTKEFYKAIGE